MLSKQKAIIIGAGVAGLACAIRLAAQGFEVSVFEKNKYPGGKLYVFEKDGYRFDTGPSLFVQPQNIEELCRVSGENIHNYLHYKPVEIACRYFYEDGTLINAYTNAEKFAEEIEQKTGEASKHVISYLKDAKKIYTNIAGIFLNHSLHKKETWLNTHIFKALKSTKLRYLFSSLDTENKKNFNSSHIVQLFDRFATYSGSNPYKAPAMLKLVSHLEIDEGVYYPQGGMMSINNALYDLAVKKNVQFFFNAPVEKIIVSNKKAKGIIINKDPVFSDVVISNVDAYFTYRDLLNDKHTANKLLQQERSSSALIFYWGINKEFTLLDLHNIFFSNDYEAEFNSIFNDKEPFSDPTIYINITSKMEPGVHAPAGKENWFVMVNVPSTENINDQTVIDAYKKNILAKLNRILHTSVELLIESETVLYPKLIEKQTASYLGALYGISSNSIQAAFLRHPNYSKHIQGLYFAGGSVHPGGGIPLCLKSAKITSDLIVHDLKKSKPHA
jgi:phytoene desaturase